MDAEPDAAAELADQCCRLPLALRVAAELAVSRPATSLAGLAGEAADLRTRLDLLDASGDPRSAVRAVFSWSYRNLDTAATRTFRLAGLHPGPDVDAYAAAALTSATVEQARRALDTLARAHLIQLAGLEANQHGYPSSQVTPIAQFREYYRHPVPSQARDPASLPATMADVLTGQLPMAPLWNPIGLSGARCWA